MGAEVTRSEDYLGRYAELVVRVAANVQPDQEVVIGGLVEHTPVARAIARQAYLAGARRVTVDYQDLQVQHAAAELGPVEWLGRPPEHVLAGIRRWEQDKPAVIRLTGNPAPELFNDLDPVRVAALAPKDKAAVAFPLLSGDVVAWTVVAAPNKGWARAIFGAPELERLWAAVAQATRLDRPDPVLAWREHVAELQARAATLEARRFDAIHFRGPGTDLTVGLIPGARWLGGSHTNSTGVEFVPNLPTEEVYTSPDRRRAHGTVRLTYPLVVPDLHAYVEGLELRLADGRIVEATAEKGGEAIRAQLASEPNAGYLGEVALVDGTLAVRSTGLVFGETLYDENAGSHIAYGVPSRPCWMPPSAAVRIAVGLGPQHGHRSHRPGDRGSAGRRRRAGSGRTGHPGHPPRPLDPYRNHPGSVQTKPSPRPDRVSQSRSDD